MPLLSPPEESTCHYTGRLNSAPLQANPAWLDRQCRQQVHARLAKLQGGKLRLCEGNRVTSFGATHQADPLVGELNVRHPRFYRRLVLGGSLAAAESFIDGDWTTPHLPELLQLFARDWAVSCDIDSRLARWRTPLAVAWSRLKKNTIAGSRKNIAAHYDLSNAFYQLWLDDSMAYSAGIFPTPNSTLAQASQHKFDLACQKLDLHQNDDLLEIGTGWGGLAIHAVQQFGCQVTTTTISKQQGDFAEKKINAHGLESRVELLDCDYRHLTGSYDKIVSIEMIEAVGHEYLPTFFAKCSDLLKPGGKLMLQAITIPDQRYDRYRRSVDFIQKYIFPGGALPSLGAIQTAIARHTNLRLVEMQDYAEHYARTLECWRNRFFDRLDQVRELGFDEKFIRMWDYYFSYCEAGFRERQIGLAHLVFEK